MNSTELKEIVAKSNEQEWFQNVSATFPLAISRQSFTGLTAIYEFVSQQVDGWNTYENLPSELSQSKVYFENIKNAIDKFVSSYAQQDVRTLNLQWDNIAKTFIDKRNQKTLLYNIPEVDFLIKVYQNSPDYFQGTYHSLLQTGTYGVNTPDLLYGAILAYEFTLKDQTSIAKRRDAEESSISKIRDDFHKYLTESEQHLAKHLHDANTTYDEYVKRIDELKTEKDDSITEWFATTQKRVTELEKTYTDKLKLEEPAKYWDNRAKSLQTQGWKSLFVLVLCLAGICITLSIILCTTPETIFASWFDNDKTAAIKWTIVYATLISFMAFVLRALSKYMFSSFHLARDCEERHTLTYFYLSLLKDSSVTDGDRQLIMQSLFSRADTGLLKEDSAPTMPHEIMKVTPG